MPVDPGQSLSAVAQIAVTIAGFTSVAGIFAEGPGHRRSPLERFRLSMMLIYSGLAVFFCVVGLVLLSTELREALVWRIGSITIAAALAVAGVASSFAFHKLHLRRVKVGRLSEMLFVGMAGLGIASMVLQIYNAWWVEAFWPFFVGVAIQTLGSMFQFARLVLAGPLRDS